LRPAGKERKAESSKPKLRLSAERIAKVFGERIFRIPEGSGNNWKRIREKRARRIIGSAECRVPSAE